MILTVRWKYDEKLASLIETFNVVHLLGTIDKFALSKARIGSIVL